MFQQEQATWTLQQLCTLAALELDRRGAHGLGAFLPLPISVRNVRYYVHLGLLDRPQGEGTPRFGKRHLVQLMAVRALQSQGTSLSSIQRQLLGTSQLDRALVAESVQPVRPRPDRLRRRPPLERVHQALPRPRLPQVVEDRQTFMRLVQAQTAREFLCEDSLHPKPASN